MKSLLLLILCLSIHWTLKAGIFDNLQPVQIATNLSFTESPEWCIDGYLLFSDVEGNTIYKWSEEKGLETFATPSGNANGIGTSRKNEFFICRQSNRDIAKMSPNGTISSFVSNYQGKRFNSPNDLTVSYLGSVYFTDPIFTSTESELSYQGLFCIPFDQSQAVLLDNTLIKPNGLTFGNDWRTLYVCETSTNTIYSYYLRDEYKIQDISKDKKVFVKVSGAGEIDGITSDIFGNIYVAFGTGGVKIFNKDAIEIGTITFPQGEKVRNLCFGGKYNSTLFVTAEKSLYKVDIRFYGDFVASGLLGVPTNNSVIFNALSDKTMSAYLAYGSDKTALNQQTTTFEYTANTPIEITINSLNPNTNYYYQLFYKLKDETLFKTAASGSFCTQRAKGESFSFAVEADPHLDEGSNYVTFRNTLQNALNLKPDFLIDLGDNFMVEKFPVINRAYLEQRSLLYRNFWDKVCSSMPLFLVQGNHDAEQRWLTTNQADDPFNTATSIRKMYYPTPEPDNFYTGSDAVEAFVGKRENYYAWNWGDALFVVLDSYGYVESKTNDPWCFTLGKKQYDWFRKTLEESTAKFKFVFAHQLIGGDNLGRGGAEIADYFEMGGKNSDGSYGFDDKRVGWGKPLHQIMVENGVQIYFHGHDHIYAEQEKDGIIYQEVPQPSFPAYTVANDAATYGYVTGTILPNSGHLNIKVEGELAKVDYIGGFHVDNPKANLTNGIIRRTYTVKANNYVSNSVSTFKDSFSTYQAGDYLYVKASTSTSIQINLYTLTGQYIAPLYNGKINVGTSVYSLPTNLSSGMYFAKFQSPHFCTTLKIIKP